MVRSPRSVVAHSEDHQEAREDGLEVDEQVDRVPQVVVVPGLVVGDHDLRVIGYVEGEEAEAAVERDVVQQRRPRRGDRHKHAPETKEQEHDHAPAQRDAPVEHGSPRGHHREQRHDAEEARGGHQRQGDGGGVDSQEDLEQRCDCHAGERGERNEEGGAELGAVRIFVGAHDQVGHWRDGEEAGDDGREHAREARGHRHHGRARGDADAGSERCVHFLQVTLHAIRQRLILGALGLARALVLVHVVRLALL
mmetsp:Transcript_18529/g.54188  ORF Transcript_18529/g.54188 Transcript_18529/m.54188 type:complete len:252 (-) Transcript_18529:275-1030(-)